MFVRVGSKIEANDGSVLTVTEIVNISTKVNGEVEFRLKLTSEDGETYEGSFNLAEIGEFNNW